MATLANDVSLAAPVRRVTLLEDRAQVVREGALVLGPGVHRLRVEGVSPVIGDRSLVARSPSPGVRVDEVRVVRRWARTATATPASPEAEPRRLQLERGQREEERQLAERRRELASHAATLVLDAVARELPFASAYEERWEKQVEQLLASLRAANEELAARDAELEDLGARERALAVGEPPSIGRVLVADVIVDVTVRDAGEHRLSVEYMVPCALWRPIHRATLSGGTIRFECEAAVWQATGEDWRDVLLSFSTARPTRRADPPVLSDDLLAVKRRAEKKVEVAIREEAIATTGGGQGRASSELPGVDDGGETRLLGSPTAATVRSSGRLARVPILAFEAAAEVDRVSCPERSSLVHWRSRQTNESRHPILAGPVDLLRESGHVGRSEVGFVAPGERFVLGWGPDEALRVRRSVNEQRERATITGRQTITRTVVLSLSNLDSLPAELRLEERVPVSEIEKVTVEVDAEKTIPRARPDDQGIVAWAVKLPARGTETVRLVYRVVAASDVQGL